MSCNDKQAKYDNKEWDAQHKKMGKGISLSVEELKKLKDILDSIEL
ncbi:hypothetical protein KPL48_05680 [Clostridium estertheticum]|nr:hypothetical protein [Clostridium estertheticum]MBU3198778.1 hypothetical protein [Clostridium estertheticum]